MSAHHYREDQRPDWVDTEKSWLMRHMSSLTAWLLVGGFILFLVAIPVTWGLGLHNTSWMWWFVGAWLVLALLTGLVRKLLAGNYNRAVQNSFRAQKADYLRREPTPQSTAFGASIALAADEARIEAKKIAKLAAQTTPPSSTTPASASRGELLAQAEAAQRIADQSGTSQKWSNVPAGRRRGMVVEMRASAEAWIHAAAAWREAGDPAKARIANEQAYKISTIDKSP